MSAALLVMALRDPASTATLDADGWTGLIAAARAEQLLGSLAWRLDGSGLPAPVARLLADARASAGEQRRAALWEVEMARRALAPLGCPVVLLKGSAFVAAGLAAGVGRSIGDLDILVPRDALNAVEAALRAAGWEWVKPDPYDDAYYRRWMHELPPLIHPARDRMIDVHHTILPPTARITPDAAALIAASVELENGLRVLSPEDMVVHAAAHLFADGDLAGGLRNLWDVHRLVAEMGDPVSRHPGPVPGSTDRPGERRVTATTACVAQWAPEQVRGDGAETWARSLAARARRHGLEREVARALRLAAQLYEKPGRMAGADRLYLRRLLARDGWGRATRPATQFGFYLRSHWLRMPPAMLARHLWTKWRRG